MKTEKANFYKLCIQAILYATALIFVTGAVVQTFLLLLGFSDEQVYVYSSITQFAQITVMTALVFLSGRMKRHRLYSAITELLMLSPLIVFLIGAIDPTVFSNTYIAWVFILSVIASGAIGLHSVIQYCLPYAYLDMADYGKLTGISTALAGGVGFLVSSFHSFAVQRFGYIPSMRWFFILGMALLVLSVIVTVSLKRVNNAPVNGDGAVDRGELVAVFRNPDMYYLLIPNFCRGLALGVMGVIAIITISTDTLTPEETSYINVILQAACFGANVVFALLYKKLGIARILLISSIATSLIFPFVLGGGSVIFLVLFFVTVFFRYIVDSAIPTAIAAMIPENQIGAYTAIRMLVFTGAQAVAALLITPIVSLVGYTGVLIFAAVMQLICGVGHYLVISLRHSKNPLLR